MSRRRQTRGIYTPDLKAELARKGIVQDIAGVPQDLKDLFVTALDIPPEQHVRIQAAFQKYTDNAVSKTVNLPADATVSDVLKVYNLAYDLGCKGVTVFGTAAAARCSTWEMGRPCRGASTAGEP